MVLSILTLRLKSHGLGTRGPGTQRIVSNWQWGSDDDDTYRPNQILSFIELNNL